MTIICNFTVFIFNGHHAFGRTTNKSIISSRQNTLTGTKDVTYIGCLRILVNCFRTDFGIASDGNRTETAVVVVQCIRHILFNAVWCAFVIRFCNIVSGHRSNLATTIDVSSHLGIALNGDRRVAAYQC